MKYVSWNVNGLRACLNKGFIDFFYQVDADIFAIQEIKMQEGQADVTIPGYVYYMNSAQKKGYSGTMIYTKKRPLDVHYGLDNGSHNEEGRVITLEFENYYFITAYVPNSKEELSRIDYRLIFEQDLVTYLKKLDANKPIIYCGDLNVAHCPIDIRNPEANVFNPGYSIQERTAFQHLLDQGFTDTFRYLYPNRIEYSWWSYRFMAREKNIGWRIDYFLVSNRIKNKIKEAKIFTSVLGSDHAPVFLELKEE